MSNAQRPWKLIDFQESTESGSGVTVTVEIDGYGQVSIEDWCTHNASGIDAYDEEGRAVGVDLEKRLGGNAFEYLLGEWLEAVKTAYFDKLERLGIEKMREQALATAKAVPVDPNKGSDEHAEPS